MRERLIVFEDSGCRNFAPLTHTRPVYELRLGIMGLRERCERAFATEAELICRPHLAAHIAATTGRRVNDFRSTAGGASLLLVNGRASDPFAVRALLAQSSEPAAYMNGDLLVAARITSDRGAGLAANLAANGGVLEPEMLEVPAQHVAPVPLVTAIWELPLQNGVQIRADVARLGAGGDGPDELPGVHRTGDGRLLLAPGAEVEPG